ncbi:hypothetical protein SmJEL517_g04758 [Synchytrium microbalum]|uniref:ER membrane protein complex subunit 4 n=1 Tax=Synchytrium microbalum TaxID=1806994 RepID=A0A507C3J9_9FUNG|nr:uncharacterized protein SmJEL517_g04758 [Synchytrium microbalum]TPX32093.1 hypothetical protein SmJEL517_g04758 [Synchytrium microbalum]
MSWTSLDYASLDMSRKKANKIADPVGYIASEYDIHSTRNSLKAWDIALAPAKSIPMNGFMLYMSGNSVQIFSILITVMMFWNGIKGVTGANAVFTSFSSQVTAGRPQQTFNFVKDPVFLPKLAYIGLQLVVVAMGVYKCATMGLLPTASSDWLAFKTPKTVSRDA